MLKEIQRNWKFLGLVSHSNQASRLIAGRISNISNHNCYTTTPVSVLSHHGVLYKNRAGCSALSLHGFSFSPKSSNGWQPGSRTAALSSKSSTEDGGVEGAEALNDLDFDSDNELGIDTATTEDDSSNHLITNLYPNNPDPVLARILDAKSIEQVFEAFESVSEESEKRTPYQSSQALASLWDLQKIMFQTGSIFDPDRDFSNKREYSKKLSGHPTFQKLLGQVIENVKCLDDEPLAASLLCLKKLEFNIRSPECQALVTELGNRKDTLGLPALSRLCVVMRNEGLYGSLFIAKELFPRLDELIREMDNNQGLRLISIALRSANRCTPPSLLQLYYDRIATLHKSNQLEGIDPSIYCKILLCLSDTKWIQSGPREGASPEELLRIIGHLLTPLLSELCLVDILSLQRILEFGPSEPPGFMQALNGRIVRLIEESEEETPRLDLICCLAPVSKRSVEQRKRLASFVEQYLDSYPHFEPISHLLLKILKTLKLSGEDARLYAKFWDKAYVGLESGNPRKALKVAHDYLSFNFGTSYTFRHIQFEAKVKQLLYFYIYNYVKEQQPTLIVPSDFARAYAFLLTFSWHAEPIFQENSHGLLKIFQEKFVKGIRPLEFLTLARGISASLNYQGKNPRISSRYFEQIMNFASIIEGAMEDLLKNRDDLDINEITSLAKAQLSLRKASDESAMFKKTISLYSKVANAQNLDSKEGKDIASVVVAANFNEPAISNLLLNFINANPENISPEFAQRFLFMAYSMGLEAKNPEEALAFQASYNVIERYWENLSPLGLIQSCLALSFVQSLRPPLVHNIFSVDFLNRLDEEIKSSSSNSSYILKLRKWYMELNRAVCLDLPDANVPWFHQKYCETLFSNENHQESPLEAEVYNSLGEVLGDPHVIQRHIFTPYFYLLNFLIEFDKSGRPIKKGKPRRLLSLRSPSMESDIEVGERIGILILPSSLYTTNVRSLRGYGHLRKRHLEMLGYRVVQIDPQHWNSMFMTQLLRAEYLERVIFEKRDLPKGSQLDLNLI